MPKKHNTIIIRKDCHAPLFGMKNWHKGDYKTPLTFQIDQAKIKIYLLEPPDYGRQTIIRTWKYKLEILFENAPNDYILALC